MIKYKLNIELKNEKMWNRCFYVIKIAEKCIKRESTLVGVRGALDYFIFNNLDYPGARGNDYAPRNGAPLRGRALMFSRGRADLELRHGP